MARDDGALNLGGASPFVVNLASRMKNIHSMRPPRAGADTTASEIYIFPAPPRHTPASPGQEDSTRWYRQSFAGLPRWIRALTMRRVLILGAAACYALILFNLIYGIASLARLKAWRTMPAANAMELQRASIATVEGGLQGIAPNSVLIGGIAPAYCRAENMLEAPRDARHTPRNAVGKARLPAASSARM